MRTVTILGATGSVGQSTLDLIGREPGAFAVEALTGSGNVERLAADAVRFGARLAVTSRPEGLGLLRRRLAGTGIEVAAGDDAVAEVAARPVDWTMNAIVGAAGLCPSLEVLRRGGTLALANKESLVAAGSLVMATARASGAMILPVDSEHSGVFQALRGERIAEVERLVITASGGAFRDWPLDRIAVATPDEASRHPNWAMGQRITIDSASMFNKALEVIEAHELFGLPPAAIEVLIHPESAVHALVGFRDGALMAHLGCADMRHAIGFALHYPARQELPVERLDLARLGRLTFAAPDPARHRPLALARRALDEGGLMGAVLNAAKEQALDAFLACEIGFLDMTTVVEAVMDRMAGVRGAAVVPALDEVLAADAEARARASEAAGRLGGRAA